MSTVFFLSCALPLFQFQPFIYSVYVFLIRESAADISPFTWKEIIHFSCRKKNTVPQIILMQRSVSKLKFRIRTRQSEKFTPETVKQWCARMGETKVIRVATNWWIWNTELGKSNGKLTDNLVSAPCSLFSSFSGYSIEFDSHSKRWTIARGGWSSTYTPSLRFPATPTTPPNQIDTQLQHHRFIFFMHCVHNVNIELN